MKRSEFIKAVAEVFKENGIKYHSPTGPRVPTCLDILSDIGINNLMKRLKLEDDPIYCEVCGHELPENKRL